MKRLMMAAAVVVFATAAAAADDRAVSDSTLKSMGLAAMQEMSPTEGLTVRGQGAGVWGTSTANWGGNSSTNSYAAGSSWLGKPSAAGGSTFSFAGQIQFSRFPW